MKITKDKIEKGRFILLCGIMYVLIASCAELPEKYSSNEGIEWFFALAITVMSAIAPAFKALRWLYLCYAVSFVIAMLMGIVSLGVFIVFAVLLYASIRSNKAVYDMVRKLWIPGM
jgi:uncharacterized membrane protein